VDRYDQAAETSETANLYFRKLIKGINVTDQEEWEKGIQDAESNRMRDRSVMDILGAHQPEDQSAAPSQTNSNMSRRSVAGWIQLGIDIEEKQ
jgi:hypothetical protein